MQQQKRDGIYSSTFCFLLILLLSINDVSKEVLCIIQIDYLKMMV